MPTDADVPTLRVSAYMTLEQAMAEVRGYLEAKRRHPPAQHPDSFVAGQLAMQNEFIARLNNTATQFGFVDPNSKLGPLGGFLKRVVAKVIGWYARPVHQFNRTAAENFQQIRQDMLQLQQQVAGLNERMTKLPSSRASDSISSSVTTREQSELLRSTLGLFRGLLAVAGVRQALQAEDPQLLQRVDRLLDNAEREVRADARVPDANFRT
jgi:hypothetical protein